VPVPPLVIIAIDAGDTRLVRRWIREGYLPALAALDLAPTFLALLGKPAPTELAGRPLTELV
jgi:hypothetical protein